MRVLCDTVGDTLVYQACRPLMPNGLSFGYIKSLDITCDKEFDGKHPARSSLGDLFSVSFPDAYSFIKSGYRVPSSGAYADRYEGVDYVGCQYGDCLGVSGFAVYTDTVASVDWERFGLLPFSFKFELLGLPQKAGDYTFRVLYTKSDGTSGAVQLDPVSLEAAKQ